MDLHDLHASAEQANRDLLAAEEELTSTLPNLKDVHTWIKNAAFLVEGIRVDLDDELVAQELRENIAAGSAPGAAEDLESADRYDAEKIAALGLDPEP